MSRIVVIGSLNMDLVVNSPRMPLLGETITGSDFMTCPGGKGSNQAVAASRLGAEISIIGSVGNDLFGKSLIKSLDSDGIDYSAVKVGDVQTGTATIVVIEGDNFIILDPGANGQVFPEDIDRNIEMIKSADIIMLQLEIPLNTVKYAIDLAKKYNIKIMLDPAPAVPLDFELLKQVDIFKPNEHECQIVTGLNADTVETALVAVKTMNTMGIKLPIITMGKRGVVYFDQDSQKAVHMPANDVAVVDTTAAGDCFSGALAVALAEGKNTFDAISFAGKASSLAISRYGAQPSLPYRKELE